ncbi:MAG: hypothetical protein LBN95_06000 [Prevotellaceae bacterium]|jgi:hypothetical protein|nr:hypothetical protein [Prevotellaceae bacterium]
MTTKTKLPEGVTPEMVAGYKERHGEKNVKLAILMDEDGNELRQEIVRVPDRKTLGEFEKWLDKQPLKAKEILVQNCVLTNKEAIKAEDILFSAAYNALIELIPVGKFKLADL